MVNIKEPSKSFAWDPTACTVSDGSTLQWQNFEATLDQSHRNEMSFSRRKRNAIDCTVASILLTTTSVCQGFSIKPSFAVLKNTRLNLFAPPGSGYATPEDEELKLPSSYEPMMEYPGTMRPGRTPENMPFHDLPIADTDPDPVPWPHFQQIEWHHRWDPPHPHPIPMELFIEQNDRWASAEDEAAMRAGARRDVRERRELAEQERKTTLIIDDDDEDEDEIQDLDIPVELGEGMYGALGSGSEEAITAAAVSKEQVEEPEVDTQEEDDFDDFLLDLGLDADVTDGLLLGDDTDVAAAVGDDKKTDDKGDSTANLLDAMTSMLDSKDDGGEDIDLDLDLGLMDDPDEGTVDIKMDTDDKEENDASAVAALSDDEDLDLGVDEEDEDLTTDGGMTMVPLEDFGDDSLLDDEDAFDDGGFDYDGGGGDGGDGGDMW